VHFFAIDRGPGGTNDCRPMEDRERARTEEALVPPFSELISRWLDEGERLSEAMSASKVAAASMAETPFRRALLGLRGGVERHRLAVLVCAGLLPFALFLATQHSTRHSTQLGAPIPVVSPSASSPVPITANPAPSPPRGIVHELAVAVPEAPRAVRKAVVAAPQAPRAARRVAVAIPKRAQAAHPIALAVPKAPPAAPPVALAVPNTPPAARQTAVAGLQVSSVARPVGAVGSPAPPVVRQVALASPKAPHVAPRPVP